MAKIPVPYYASETLTRFHESEAFVRGIRGPRASGKSTGCCWEIKRRAALQAPAPDGKRYTRWAVVRATYPELRDTTIKTHLQWTPEKAAGPMRYHPMPAHHIQTGDIDCEILFRALETPDDIRKVLSLELTGAWVNEARELPSSLMAGLADAVGRYPPQSMGGPTWRGIFMDTNPPDDDHWWYRHENGLDLNGNYVGLPEGWEFFVQPPGMIEENGVWRTNPEAENLANIEDGFYPTRAAGRPRDHILVYYANQFGFVQEGKPVYREYVDHIHAAADPIKPNPAWKLYVGLDFGLQPAALFSQKTQTGKWLWIDEIVTDDMGAARFAEILGPKLRGEYKDFEIEVYGDPSGDSRAQTDESTPFDILRSRGIDAVPAPSNDPVVRHEALAAALNRRADIGFAISPRCPIARKGLAGGYAYRRLQVAGQDRYVDKPIKNRFSHIVEAGEYSMIGAGEGDAAVYGQKGKKRKPLEYKYNYAPV